MNAGERFHLFLQRRKLRKILKRKGINPDDQFFIVDDFGWEDCCYDGPFSLNEAISKFMFRERKEEISFYFFDTSATHYITNDRWRIRRIDERREDN